MSQTARPKASPWPIRVPRRVPQNEKSPIKELFRSTATGIRTPWRRLRRPLHSIYRRNGWAYRLRPETDTYDRWNGKVWTPATGDLFPSQEETLNMEPVSEAVALGREPIPPRY